MGDVLQLAEALLSPTCVTKILYLQRESLLIDECLPIHSTVNKIGGTGAEHISRCLTSNTTLLHLDLACEFLLIDEC